MALYFWGVHWQSSVEELGLNCSFPKKLNQVISAWSEWHWLWFGEGQAVLETWPCFVSWNTKQGQFGRGVRFCPAVFVPIVFQARILTFSLETSSTVGYFSSISVVSVCDWQRRGDLVKRDFDWNLLQLFGCLTGEVHFWPLNKISNYKIKTGH